MEAKDKKNIFALLIFILATLKINSEQNAGDDSLTEEVYGSNGLKIQLDDSAKRLLVNWRPSNDTAIC